MRWNPRTVIPADPAELADLVATEPEPEPLSMFRWGIEYNADRLVTKAIAAAYHRPSPFDGRFIEFYDSRRSLVFSIESRAVVTIERLDEITP